MIFCETQMISTHKYQPIIYHYNFGVSRGIGYRPLQSIYKVFQVSVWTTIKIGYYFLQ